MVLQSDHSAQRPRSGKPRERAVDGPAVAPQDYARLAEFRYALRCFMAFSEEAAREAGLTAQQHQALLAIKGLEGNGGVTISDLAARLLIRHHSAVELVDRLTQNGFLRRGSDPGDARRTTLTLTQDGELKLRRLSASHLEELSRIGPGLSAMLTRFAGQSDTA